MSCDEVHSSADEWSGPREIQDGDRIGRFVFLRDLDGRRHAVASTGIGAMCETDDGTLLMLPGGRMLRVPQAMDVIIRWLDMRGPA